MYTDKIGVISISIIGIAAVLMVFIAPTLENQQALAFVHHVMKEAKHNASTEHAKRSSGYMINRQHY